MKALLVFLSICILHSTRADCASQSTAIGQSSCISSALMPTCSEAYAHPSRLAIVDYINISQIKEVLEIGCGTCIDAQLFQKEGVVKYIGVDLRKRHVYEARKRGFQARQGDVECLKFEANYIECVYARHVIEFLQDYKTALAEMIRVATNEVIVTFGQVTLKSKSYVRKISTPLGVVRANVYSRARVEEWLLQNPKVFSVYWQGVIDSSDTILHIHLKKL